ncbi:hypothetical protein [Flavivirga eckloniae]|uniref:Uncharacterized protein n=1 Tax=Flavivirga eckloniae TaxID=1803846 RepID=A0A2K9PSB0_9FLAO|nr:hypothetical protein [Flavivirga eckloniae]AUP79688.1 hypothetical protein C1H87_13615 [Flavivirga eckloniae]
MIITPKIKVTERIEKIEFYEIEYYEDFDNDLRLLLNLFLDIKRVYFSFGRFDMFYDGNIESLHTEIKNEIKEFGKIDEITSFEKDNFSCCGFLEFNDKTINTVINIFRLYYSCSFDFFEKNIDYNRYFEIKKNTYKVGDIDGENLFKELKYSYSFYKGLGPDIVCLSYDKIKSLPFWLRSNIPKPPPRGKSFMDKLKNKIYGYPWVDDEVDP